MSDPIPSELIERRNLIGDAMAAVERALEAPAATGAIWRERVGEALQHLDDLAISQIAAYLEPGGALDAMTAASSRLSLRIEKVRASLESFAPRLRSLIGSLAAAIDAEEVRADARTLLDDMTRVRQRLADLFYDAYTVDIGGVG